MASYLARGKVFRPTDKECVEFLKMKVSCDPKKKVSPELANGFLFIGDGIDIYEHEPSKLPSLAPKTGEEIMYFFSPLHKKGKNAERKVLGGRGYWKIAGNIEQFHYENENLIATKTSLSYYKKDERSASINGEWLMKEYVLASDQLLKPQDQAAGTSKELEPWTLCIIYHKGAMTKNQYTIF